MKKCSLWPLLMLAPWVVQAQTEVPLAPPAGEHAPPASVSALQYPGATGQYPNTLAQLHDKLALTPQQQALWQTYAGKVDAYTAQYYREKPVMPSAATPAPQQVVGLVQNLQNRLTALEDIEQAAKQLYAALNPEQQKTANQLLLSTIPTFAGPGNTAGPAQDSRSPGGRRGGDMRARSGGTSGGQGGWSRGGF